MNSAAVTLPSAVLPSAQPVPVSLLSVNADSFALDASTTFVAEPDFSPAFTTSVVDGAWSAKGVLDDDEDEVDEDEDDDLEDEDELEDEDDLEDDEDLEDEDEDDLDEDDDDLDVDDDDLEDEDEDEE